MLLSLDALKTQVRLHVISKLAQFLPKAIITSVEVELKALEENITFQNSVFAINVASEQDVNEWFAREINRDLGLPVTCTRYYELPVTIHLSGFTDIVLNKYHTYFEAQQMKMTGGLPIQDAIERDCFQLVALTEEIQQQLRDLSAPASSLFNENPQIHFGRVLLQTLSWARTFKGSLPEFLTCIDDTVLAWKETVESFAGDKSFVDEVLTKFAALMDNDVQVMKRKSIVAEQLGFEIIPSIPNIGIKS